MMHVSVRAGDCTLYTVHRPYDGWKMCARGIHMVPALAQMANARVSFILIFSCVRLKRLIDHLYLSYR